MGKFQYVGALALFFELVIGIAEGRKFKDDELDDGIDGDVFGGGGGFSKGGRGRFGKGAGGGANGGASGGFGWGQGGGGGFGLVAVLGIKHYFCVLCNISLSSLTV